MTLFLECNADEVLAMAVGIPPKAIVHTPSKGGVAKALSKNKNVIGMVDEDPGSAEPGNLKGFVAHGEIKHDLILRLDEINSNRLVVVCPRLEPWLIKTAKMADLPMQEYSLSENLRNLDAEINNRLPNVKRLVGRLLELKSPRLLHLKSLLEC